jgi:hypothetical protein
VAGSARALGFSLCGAPPAASAALASADATIAKQSSKQQVFASYWSFGPYEMDQFVRTPPGYDAAEMPTNRSPMTV